MRRIERRWIAIAVVLAGLAIPWFLWGSATVVAGLPVWLWWHICWMGVASIVFVLFTKRAWGIGIKSNDQGSSTSTRGAADAVRGPNSGDELP